jgi:hypothetical protein
MKRAEQTWDKGFEGTKKRQALNGLKLTPHQRLQWLTNMIQLFETLKKSN